MRQLCINRVQFREVSVSEHAFHEIFEPHSSGSRCGQMKVEEEAVDITNARSRPPLFIATTMEVARTDERTKAIICPCTVLIMASRKPSY